MNTIFYPTSHPYHQRYGAAQLILPLRKNDTLLLKLYQKILSIKSLLCFLTVLLFTVSTTTAQGPCPTSNCVSGDIRITKVELLKLDGSQLPSSCAAGTSIQIKLRVTFDVTSATRYGFLVVSKLYLNNNLAGTISNCDPATFSQGIHTMDVAQYINGDPIMLACGSLVQLKDTYTAWDQQAPSLSHPGVCTFLNANGTISDCQEIAPKCKFYGENEPIEIVAPLVASFTASEGSCSGLKRSWTFTSTSIGGKTPYTYTWNFGDGTPPLVTTQNPVTHEYAYSVSGNVNVTLSVEDASSPTHQVSATQPQTISVTSCCVASTAPTGASAVQSSICSGSNTNISVTGGALGTGAAWKWYVGGCGNGTSIGTGATINVNPTQTTTYYVRAEGDCGTTSCASVTVTIKNPSTAPTGASAVSAIICNGQSTGLSVTGGSLGAGASWKWYAGGCASGSSIGTGASITVSPSATTTYYVRAEGECNNTTCASVVVTVQQPISNNTIQASQTICSGNIPAALTGSTPSGGDGNYSYQWQIKTTGGFSNISGANSKDYAPGAISEITQFRRIVSAGAACANSTSAAVTISISAESQVYAISGTNFCISAPNTGTVKLMDSYAGVTYQLKNAADDSDVQPAQIGTGDALTWTGLGAGTYYVYGTGLAPTFCTSQTANVTVFMFDCSVFYTLTQGYYGGKNGKSCIGSNPVNTIKYLLGTTDLVTGTTNSVTVPATNEGAMKLNQTMPGGNTPNALPAGNCIITTGCFVSPTYLTSQARINNILLSQTITLGLNVRWQNGQLLLFPIKSGYLTTQKMKGCFPDAVLVEVCESGTISSLLMNQNVVNYLGANGTVGDLLQLANDVLGGTKTPGIDGVPSYADVNEAVDCINKSFDEGRRFLNYFETKQTCEMLFPSPALPVSATTTIVSSQREMLNTTTITAYPNPFSDNISFDVDAKESGKAMLEVYTVTGQKVKTVYNGSLNAGRQRFTLTVPTHQRSVLFYVFIMGDQKLTGKLLFSGR